MQNLTTMTQEQHEHFTKACLWFGEQLEKIFGTEAPTLERQEITGIWQGEPAYTLKSNCKVEIEKDWEILEFKATYRHGFPGDTVKVSEAINKEHWMEHYLDSMKQGAHAIHSVRRLSDNTIWTVGDKTDRGVIDCFMISEGALFVCGIDWATFLRTVVKPAPLFTTADGVDHYDEEDIIWVFFSKSGRGTVEQRRYKDLDEMDWAMMGPRLFSTREAAEKAYDAWLTEQPLISIKELDNERVILFGRHRDYLKQLVKDKIAKG